MAVVRSNKVFWILQLSGWGIYWLYIITNAYSMGYYGVRYIIWNTLVVAVGFALTTLARGLYSRIDIQHLTLIKTILISLISTMLIVNIWYIVRLLINSIMIRPGEQVVPVTLSYYLQGIFFWSILIFVWNTLYFVIKLWLAWNYQRDRSQEAELLAQRSKLQMLRYQLNPHFLFNSLNSIRALIEENSKTAREMITELSEFLRYSLISEYDTSVPLRTEIEALQHYFAIEKKRYEDKLNILFDIDSMAGDFPVIRFLLHPLAENAVKYGMRTSPMPLQIQVIARLLENTLVLEVSNSGKWIEPSAEVGQNPESTNTGLNNVRQCLENAFPGQHSFEVIQKPHSVHFKIEIQKPAHSK